MNNRFTTWGLFPFLIVGLIFAFMLFDEKKEPAAPTLAAYSEGDEFTAITSAKINSAAPAFSLQGLDGGQYHVGGARSKPLLLNFWASWCGPCEEEAPYLKALGDKYQDRLDVYAVNVTANDKIDDVNKFVATYQFKFPVLLDKKEEATRLYRIRGIPTTFLIDKNGTIRDAFNYIKPEDLEKRVKLLLE
ncbi:TlpA family protein disulfide reductase [Paenibacillus sp. y28]|uniref:TlpA family protein disulfide reductase n=1 Tax=Paenibacillus sp. y28 TaxID=3129110 RepID=UPI003016F506